jgi:hypothetical protein
MAKQTQQFTLNTEPHEAEVGPHTFLFKPEVYSDEYLEAWATMRSTYSPVAGIAPAEPTGDDGEAKSSAADATVDRAKENSVAIKTFVAAMMLDDDDVDATAEKRTAADDPISGPAGATVFLQTKLPDRVVLELEQWILGVYGLRPTGPSSGSSEPSSTEPSGDASTGSSPSAE